jgi:short-subunit dehydrogenase
MNTGALASIAPMPHVSVYAASKIYTDYLVDPLNFELSEYGVEVSAFRPGAVNTNIINFKEG